MAEALAIPKLPNANLNDPAAASTIRKVNPSQIVLITLSPDSSDPAQAENNSTSGFRAGGRGRSLNTRLITFADELALRVARALNWLPLDGWLARQTASFPLVWGRSLALQKSTNENDLGGEYWNH